jgi:hypothetical protein
VALDAAGIAMTRSTGTGWCTNEGSEAVVAQPTNANPTNAIKRLVRIFNPLFLNSISTARKRPLKPQ